MNAYGIAFAAGIITAAALGGRFGRRLVFGSGLALFTLASAACALAPNMAELIAARTVQGLGAAMVLPLSLTILTTAFPAEKRGMIVGVYGGLAGLAVALGPIVGGVITEATDWHWIFWINVPIGLVAVLLGRQFLPESHGPSEWLLVIAFLLWEQRTAAPMVPLRLFANRPFALGNVTTFFLHGATFAVAFFITQEFQLARLGTVFAVAIATAVFSVHGHLGSPASVSAGFRPALWVCVCFALLATVSGLAIASTRHRMSIQAEPAELPLTA